MADLSILITQELLRLSEQLILPTRIYFPSGTFTADVAPAFDAGWNNTASAVVRKAVTDGRKRGTAAASVTVTGTAANPETMLHAQYVSKPLRAQTIAGNIRGQFRALESATGANATIQIGIRVVSQDGATVRATLLAVGGTVTTATTPPEFATSLTNRRLLTSGDVTPLPLTSYTCKDGDRLVIEIGHSNKSTSTTQTHGISFGDNTVDLTTDDTQTVAQDPWIEFDSTILFDDQVETVRISDGGVTQLQNTGWLRIADTVTAQLSAGADLNKNLGDAEVLHVVDTVTASRGIEATPSESLKIAESIVAGSIIQASATESLKIAESGNQTLDALEAAPSEGLKLADGPVSTLPIWMVTVATESITLRDAGNGNGLTQLIGVVHITDGPVTAALIAGSGLAVAVVSETVKIAESLTAIEDETVSVSDSLKIAESLTVIRDIEATSSESLRIAESLTLQIDPVQVAPSESLRMADTPFATFDLYGITAETLRLADSVTGGLTPLVAQVADEPLRIADTDLALGRTLEVVVSSEALKLSETASPQLSFTASVGPESLRIADTLSAGITPLQGQATDEGFRISDSLSALSVLAVTITPEIVRMADRVVILAASITESIRLSDSGGGSTGLLGTLRIQDGPVQAQVGTGLSIAITESLRLAESFVVERSPFEATAAETVKIGYTFSEVEFTRDEYARMADAVNAIVLAPNDLSTLIAQESLRLADVPTVARDLEVSPAEALKLAETSVAAVDELASVSESLRIAESLSASRDVDATLAEALRVADSTIGQEDPLGSTPTESFRVQDAISLSLGAAADLSVGGLTETLKLADSATSSVGLFIVLSESVLLAEQVASGDGTRLTALLSESVHVHDLALGEAELRAGLDQEDVRISDTVQAVLALVALIAPERVRGQDDDLLQLGLDLATDIPDDATAIRHGYVQQFIYVAAVGRRITVPVSGRSVLV